jgi:hypothetical protein
MSELSSRRVVGVVASPGRVSTGKGVADHWPARSVRRINFPSLAVQLLTLANSTPYNSVNVPSWLAGIRF